MCTGMLFFKEADCTEKFLRISVMWSVWVVLLVLRTFLVHTKQIWLFLGCAAL